MNEFKTDTELISAICDQPQATKKPEHYFFRASADDFKKIPGSPIAYWLSTKNIDLFDKSKKLGDVSDLFKGLSTGENEAFIRIWYEVSLKGIYFDCTSNVDSKNDSRRWYPCNKGGSYRKWYGNRDSVIDWENDGQKLRSLVPKSVIRSSHNYFKPCLSWSKVSSGAFSMRYFDMNFVPLDSTSALTTSLNIFSLLAMVNSKPFTRLLKDTSATLNYEISHLSRMPISIILENEVNTQTMIDTHKKDWNFYETSWEFSNLSLLKPGYRLPTLKTAYLQLRTYWQETTLEMQHLEEENNRIFIEAYGLQDELTPDVPLNEITLTCNPYYRYGKKVESVNQEVDSDGKKTFPFDPELEDRLWADTMKEFISYAVGCMFGRYSLDAPGLILANQGEGVADYIRKVESGKCEVGSDPVTELAFHSPLSTSHSSGFMPDDDNVIPILNDNWFTDDITDRFQQFLKVTFGDEHYEDNLKFIEQAIGKSIRKFFLKDFYVDHVKRYKKRPIYWLFSSPKGNFNALIYMHRYRPDTVSVILNDYLREFRTKLTARKEHLEKVSISTSADNREKTTALKEIEKLTKIIDELNDYETLLYDLATKNIEIDLDDGVKVNYPKFGKALKKILGLG